MMSNDFCLSPVCFFLTGKKNKTIICNKLLSGIKMAFEYHLKSMGSYDTIKSKIEKKTLGKPRATKKKEKMC